MGVGPYERIRISKDNGTTFDEVTPPVTSASFNHVGGYNDVTFY